MKNKDIIETRHLLLDMLFSVYFGEGSNAFYKVSRSSMRCRNRKSEKADSESCGTGLYRNSIFYGHYAAGWFSGNCMGFPCVGTEVHL